MWYVSLKILYCFEVSWQIALIKHSWIGWANVECEDWRSDILLLLLSCAPAFWTKDLLYKTFSYQRRPRRWLTLSWHVKPCEPHSSPCSTLLSFIVPPPTPPLNWQDYQESTHLEQFVTRFLLKETTNQLHSLQSSLECAMETTAEQTRQEK